MQEISNLPAYTGIVPDKKVQTDNEFANNIFGFINYSGNVFIGNFNTIITQFNVLSGEINTAATEVEDNKTFVSNAKTYITETIATLPNGTINNTTPGDNKTYSSNYINNLMDNKLGKTATATNSEKLNNITESTSSTPNTIAKRDAGGFINAAGFYSELADTTTASTHFYVQVNNNKYIRPKAIENVKAELLANAALTGVTTAPTAAVGDNSTKIATTAFVLANSNKAILGLGAVGSYAFLMLDSTSTPITPGTIYPSSSLRYAGIATELENSSSIKLFVGTGGMAAGNSWMAMGGITVTTGFKYGTLFQRIA